MGIILYVFAAQLQGGEEEHSSIRGIAVIKYGEILLDRQFANGIWIDPALDLPGSPEKLSKILGDFLCRALSEEDLSAIEMSVIRYYEKEHRPIVSVFIPPQNVSSGILQVVVIEPKIGKISLAGNRWTSSKRICNAAGLMQGKLLNSYLLQKKLAWLNRNPFRETNVILTPGEEPGTTDIELVTKERIPFRFYMGADNTGTPFLHHTRLYAGMNAGNLWGTDQQASFQWTTALNPRDLTSFSGQYMVPFPWYHQLQFYGGYSKFEGDLPEEALAQKGESWQISGRYQIPIPPIFGKFLEQVSFGYDFKRTNNELLFGGVSFTAGFADINQFYFGYMLDYATEKTSKGSKSPF